MATLEQVRFDLQTHLAAASRHLARSFFQAMVQSNKAELERLSEEWSVALARGDLDGALRAATTGYFAALAGGDHVQVMMFLGFVRHAAGALFEIRPKRKVATENQADGCSFCLKPKTSMLRGIGVAICYECIDSATKDRRQ